MLAQPTPAQAFPNRAQIEVQYFAAHPGWQAWRTFATALWTALPTLDAPGLVLATQIHAAAAWVLDTLETTAPAHVGVWSVLGPVVTATWQQWQTVALWPGNGAPHQTLQLSPGAQGALQALGTWDPVLQTNGPVSPETALVAVCQGTTIAPTQAPSATSTPAVQLVTVTADDTLLRLAAQYLGNPESWPVIQALNQLRAPYISPRLWDQYGPPVAAFELSHAASAAPFVVAPVVDAGATTVTLPGVAGPTCPPGSVLVLEQWTATGRQQEAHVVTAYQAATQVATLATAVQASYGPGALLSVNVNPAQLTTQVLAPGQTIQIPLNGTVTSTQLTNPQDPLGTDLYCSPAGQLVQTATGDLLTVTGLQNLQGALRRRLDSALGSLALHPTTYGSGLPTLVGQPLIGSHVISGYVTTSLLQDPRVSAVSSVTVTAQGNAWIILAQVLIPNLPQAVPVTTQFIAN